MVFSAAGGGALPIPGAVPPIAGRIGGVAISDSSLGRDTCAVAASSSGTTTGAGGGGAGVGGGAGTPKLGAGVTTVGAKASACGATGEYAGGGGATGAGWKFGAGVTTVGAPQAGGGGAATGGTNTDGMSGAGGGPKFGAGDTTVGAPHTGCGGAGAAGVAPCKRVPHCWQKAQSASLAAWQPGHNTLPPVATGANGGGTWAGVPGDGMTTVAGISGIGSWGRTTGAAEASSAVAHMRQTVAAGLFSAPHRGQVIIASLSSHQQRGRPPRSRSERAFSYPWKSKRPKQPQRAENTTIAGKRPKLTIAMRDALAVRTNAA
jgi:hypothetical protein